MAPSQLAQNEHGVEVHVDDLPEVLALADRILVIRDGRLQGEVAGGAADEERVMRLAAARADAAP